MNTRAPGSSNGPLAAETEPDPGELVPEVAEEDRPWAVTTGWLLLVASVAWPAAAREEKAEKETCPVLQEQWGEQMAAAQAGKTAGEHAKKQGACREEKEAPAPRLRRRVRLFTFRRETSEVGCF